MHKRKTYSSYFFPNPSSKFEQKGREREMNSDLKWRIHFLITNQD